MKKSIVNPDPSFIEAYNTNTMHKIKFVKFKLTNLCNLKCEKCNYWKNNKPVLPIWTTEKVKDIIHQLAELNAEQINFSGGEVTTRPDFLEILNYCRDKNVNTKFTTNGILINQEYAYKLIESNLKSITISIDFDTPEEHDKSVGHIGAWEKTTSAVRNLVLARKQLKRNLYINIACVVSKLNYLKLDKIVLLASELGADGINFIPMHDYSLENKSLKIKESEITQFNNTVRNKLLEIESLNIIDIANDFFWGNLGDGNDFNSIEYKHNIYEKIPCYVSWFSFYISLKGQVFPCCYRKDIDANIGNVYESSLSSLLHSQKFQEFRKSCKPPIESKNCNACLDWVDQNNRIFSQML